MCPESTSFLISRLIVRTDVPVISANLVCELDGSTFISEIMRLWSSIDSLITSNPLIIISPIENFQAFENFCYGKSDLLFKHFTERRNSMININNINKIWVEIKEFIGNNQDLIHFLNSKFQKNSLMIQILLLQLLLQLS